VRLKNYLSSVEHIKFEGTQIAFFKSSDHSFSAYGYHQSDLINLLSERGFLNLDSDEFHGTLIAITLQ